MKSIFSTKTLNILHKAIGEESLQYLEKSNVIFSSLIHCNTNYLSSNTIDSKCNIILKKKETPKLLEDWYVYLILRSICKTWIVSGQNIRDEKDIDILKNLNFYDLYDVEKYFYMGKESFKFNHSEKITQEIIKKFQYNRNIVILSKIFSFDEIICFKFFEENFAKKYLFSNPIIENKIKKLENLNLKFKIKEFREYLDKNQIYILKEEIKIFENLIKIIYSKVNNPLPILSEIGPTTFKNILRGSEGENPIDFILISVYEGQISKECIGPVFPSIQEIENKDYKLINVSEKIKSEEGILTFYTLVKTNLL